MKIMDLDTGVASYVEVVSPRDYFAAAFAAEWVAVLSRRRDVHGYSDTAACVEANRLGLLQADAMLKAREQ